MITQGPLNTVAKIGGNQVKLNCIADGAIGFWYLSKNGSSPLTIVGPGCSTVHPAFANHYSVQLLDGGHTCNLIVSNITMEQAGVYRCSEYDSRYSLFTVIGKCQCHNYKLIWFYVNPSQQYAFVQLLYLTLLFFIQSSECMRCTEQYKNHALSFPIILAFIVKLIDKLRI